MTEESRANNKRSLLYVGTLLLCLAGVQGPLWRSSANVAFVAVREGRAMLIASDRAIAQVAVNQTRNATAEVVGNHEVLVRGKLRGDTELAVTSTDGQTRIYRVSVRPAEAR
jgi:hypothetical protein